AVAIIGGLLFIRSLQIAVDFRNYTLNALDYITLVIFSLMILVSGFGLTVVCSAESARLLKVFSWLFNLIVLLQYVYAVFITIEISSSAYSKYFWHTIIFSFIDAFIATYFAKVISDYASSTKDVQDDTPTPGRMEVSNVTNSH
ncbi:20948_t:CDS:2, partial [Racocetra persica]